MISDTLTNGRQAALLIGAGTAIIAAAVLHARMNPARSHNLGLKACEAVSGSIESLGTRCAKALNDHVVRPGV